MGASISSSEYEEEYMREPLLNESFNSDNKLNSPTPIRFYSSEDDEHQYMRMSKLSFFN